MGHFENEIRSWLEKNCPESMRTPMIVDEIPTGGRKTSYKNPDTKIWLDRMAERGFTAPRWPKEFGGAGLTAFEHKVLQQELERIGARVPLVGMGLSMIGPAILELGDNDQKKQHLPNIVKGEIMWCQGYSEPGSGSDLASLRTTAVSDGDDFIINGQKIWTSGADRADWIFCLVRTAPDAPKHEGISFILFDMESAGVSVKPIKLISGLSPFCETFFDDVRVPKSNVVGKVNEGWTVAKRLLQYERTTIGDSRSNQKELSLEEVARRYAGSAQGKIANPVIRDKVVRQNVNDFSLKLSLQRMREEGAAGKAMGAESSMFKYYATEQNKRRYDLMMSIMGTDSLRWTQEVLGLEEDYELQTTRNWLRSKANSIEGGTSEVQLNILAKRVLGLPDK